MFLEELSKRGLIGKIQHVGYLLNGEIRIPQKYLGFAHQRFTDPLVDSPSTETFHYTRQVLGCNAQFARIERNGMFCPAMFVQ